MPAGEDDDVLRRFLRERHVHCAIDPEWLIRCEQRTVSGFEIRLFGALERGARALPGSSKARALSVSLRDVARAILPRLPPATRYEHEPFSPVLYDSKIVQDVDEVAVNIRVITERGGTQASWDEHVLQGVRQRLKTFRIPEQ